MNQNWIVENLNSAFSTWNGKLSELWGLVTTSPEHFKGGAVWAIMQTLHNAMVGIGYALIVLFFAISLFKNTANFHELKRPEAALHYLIRFVAAKALVGYGMDLMLTYNGPPVKTTREKIIVNQIIPYQPILSPEPPCYRSAQRNCPAEQGCLDRLGLAGTMALARCPQLLNPLRTLAAAAQPARTRLSRSVACDAKQLW